VLELLTPQSTVVDYHNYKHLTAWLFTDMAQKSTTRLSLAEANKKLSEEWHPNLNGNLSPEDVTAHSARKVWWKCKNGHEWEATINKRSYGRNCPICSGKVASKWRNLKTENPSLAAEWHSTMNKFGPENYLPNSSKKVWWICPNGHEWEATIYSRKVNSCPICNLRHVTKDGKRKTLKEEAPYLLEEIDNEIEEPLKISDLYIGSNRSISWKGKCGHQWKTTIRRRLDGRRCPYCANQLTDISNNLPTKFPKLIDEWDFEKNTKDPNLVNPGSPEKVWWKCIRGHSWQAKINSRTRQGTGCPSCNPQTSKTEIRVLSELEALFEEKPLWRSKVANYEADILFKSKKIIIEVDGYPWHDNENSYKRDRQKNKIFQESDYVVYRLRDYRLKAISGSKNVSLDELNLVTSIKSLVNAVAHDFPKIVKSENLKKYVSDSSYVNESGYSYLVNLLPGPEPQNSFAANCPEMIEEWDIEKNSPLTPEKVHKASGVKAFWKCKFGHSWSAIVAQRSTKKTGCPYCAGVKSDKSTSLTALFPTIAAEWHPSKNQFDPSKISSHNKISAWWVCKNGHEWKTSVGNRTSQGTGCPYCSGKKATEDRNFLVCSPDIALYFDAMANAPLSPADFTPKSEKKVTWTCPRGHSWMRSIANQVKSGPVCPICRKSHKD
jgi:very-short-patch-repair endonuclease